MSERQSCGVMARRLSKGCRGAVLSWCLAFLVAVLLSFCPGGATTTALGAELQTVHSAIETKNAQWSARDTSVARLSPADRRLRVGLIKPATTGPEKFVAAKPLEEPVSLPASLDWRNVGGANYISGVRDQGGCGSCWAFAVTAALESARLRAANTPGVNLDLAEQILLSCSGAGSCSGGYISTASDFVKDTGLPVESCYPYTQTNGSCTNACPNYQASTYKIQSWSWVTTTSTTAAALKNALNTYGPLVTTMDVYSDFYYYDSGVYSYTYGDYQGGHAILLVGYDDAGQYFICKNSWGTGWGESGYFRIAYSEINSVVDFGDWTIAYTVSVPTCSYSISPSSQSFTSPGGTGSITVTASSGCNWSATSGASWITIPSGSTGSGSGALSYTVSSTQAKYGRTGTITVAGQTFTVTQPGTGIRIGSAPADFNGDGKPDLVWQNQTTGQLTVWLMNGTTQTQGLWLTPSTVADTNWKIAGVADFNGDGDPDLLWQNQVTGQLTVWLMNGTTQTGGLWLTPSAVSATSWKIAGPR
jgi:C1A family cysteine protease